MDDQGRSRGLRPASAAPRTDPLTWRSLARMLAISAAVGAFLAYVGAFGTSGTPLPLRVAYMVVIAWIGTLSGRLIYRLAVRLPWIGRRIWTATVASAVLMTPLMTAVVWGGAQVLPGRGPPVSYLPGYAFNSLIMCLVMMAAAVSIRSRREPAEPAPAAPPKFLERLPAKLSGADVWAVEAEDHYLRLHTSKGQDLILMRLADAVAELEGIEGEQVHRSWWVARAAVADAERGDGRAILTLVDGCKVPVSRTYAKVLREKGWF
ncbi:LytTR family DNA-binding domain-containing protein [Phenylobacterium sp.]|uniref:LytTR family DNA-binding domain-containing protein n=1 Tax=Phenylobacterium sp. TaxID=1871053 RepID=UPI0035B396BD